MLLQVDKIEDKYVIHGIENYINPKLEHFKLDLSELKIIFEDDLSEYKQLAESAAIEKYLEKKSRDVSGQVASDRILAFREKHGLVANSVDEVLSK